jgi:UDP-N-acetylglucosamine enolpyruvyl transferase
MLLLLRKSGSGKSRNNKSRKVRIAIFAYAALLARWPRARITLRHGARVVHDTG